MPLITLDKKELWQVIKAGLFVSNITKEEKPVGQSLWLKWDDGPKLEISLDENGLCTRHPDVSEPAKEEEAYQVGGWIDPAPTDTEQREL